MPKICTRFLIYIKNILQPVHIEVCVYRLWCCITSYKCQPHAQHHGSHTRLPSTIKTTNGVCKHYQWRYDHNLTRTTYSSLARHFLTFRCISWPVITSINQHLFKTRHLLLLGCKNQSASGGELGNINLQSYSPMREARHSLRKEIGLDRVTQMTAKQRYWMTESVKFPFSPNNTFPFLHRPFPKCNTYWSVLVTAKDVRDCSDITIPRTGHHWGVLGWYTLNLKIKYL
jgi:hypothetical protein